MKNKDHRPRSRLWIWILVAAVILILGCVSIAVSRGRSQKGKQSEIPAETALNQIQQTEGLQTTETPKGTERQTETQEAHRGSKSGIPETELRTEVLEDESAIPGFQPAQGESDEAEETAGVAIPYEIPDTQLVVQEIGRYTGPFLEDGSDEPMANVAAILVKNNSEKAVQYARILFDVNDGEAAAFTCSTIPAGSSVLVLEEAKREFSEMDLYHYREGVCAEMETPSLMEDKIKVTGKNGKITVENLTDEDLGMVYVRYKYILPNQVYQGGITYESKFEHVGPRAVKETNASHYSEDGSKILMVGFAQDE